MPIKGLKNIETKKPNIVKIANLYAIAVSKLFLSIRF
jgi:hypothetical protein